MSICHCEGHERAGALPKGWTLAWETCDDCGGTYPVARDANSVEYIAPAYLGRLVFTERLLPSFQQLRVDLFKAAQMKHPSQYKGLGGSLTPPEDDPISYLVIGYAEAEERLELADRIRELFLDLHERSRDGALELVSYLKG